MVAWEAKKPLVIETVEVSPPKAGKKIKDSLNYLNKLTFIGTIK